MFCYHCGCHLTEHDYCSACGVDVSLYKHIMYVSNMYYNEALEKASVRDLSGAITSLRQSLKFDKNNIDARNLLGLCYFETGEIVAALSEWVISKNTRPEKNLANDYIDRLQSNAGRLESVNATIKKYNQALTYCIQGSKDLAIIQLKKVLSLNPKYVRAHQLLALIYMDEGHWEKAKAELDKAAEVDCGNTLTRRYQKEAGRMLDPTETPLRPKKAADDFIRYQNDNELIIQPLSSVETHHSGVPTLLAIFIGLLIGAAAVYYLVVPNVRSEALSQGREDVAAISNELDIKSSTIVDLESQIASLESGMQALEAEIETYAGSGGTLEHMDSLLLAAATYLETNDLYATAEDLNDIAQNVDLTTASDAFVALYEQLVAAIGPELSVSYYTSGIAAYEAGDIENAIFDLRLAVGYNSADEKALYALALAYFADDDTASAYDTYQRYVELFPTGSNAAAAVAAMETIEMME